MNTSPFNTAQLFVAQTQLCLDDPDGEYTAGTPQEVIAWVAEYIVAATDVDPCADTPGHMSLALTDGSAIIVVPVENDTPTARIACIADIVAHADWSGEGPAWVSVGGQPEATRYLELLYAVVTAAPHPAEIVLAARAQSYRSWANTMLAATAGQHGQHAMRAASDAWKHIQASRGIPDHHE